MVNVGSMFTFITKCTLKNTACGSRGRFTFTICSHFRRTGIVVPLYSHATKSTPTPSYHSDTQKSFDPPLRTKSNYSLPKLTHQKPQQNKLSPHHFSLPYLTTIPQPNPNKSNTNKKNIT